MRSIDLVKIHQSLAEGGSQASDAKGWGLAGVLAETVALQWDLQLLFRVGGCDCCQKNRTQAWMRFFRADKSSPGGIRTCDQSINSRSLYR